jgi:PAS domain S-box-containing protein
MIISTFNVLKFSKYWFLRGFLLVLLFGFLLLLDQSFNLGPTPDLVIRLTTGLAFMVYVLASFRKWLVIITLQVGLIFLFNFRQPLLDNLILTFSETLTSLISASIFLFINKSAINIVRSGTILKILVSAILGSLMGGSLAGFSLMIVDYNGFQALSWITWVLSSLTGIVLMAPFIFAWRTIKMSELAGLVHRSMLELSLLVISVLIATHLIFSSKINDIYISISFPYLILPFIFWAAIRFHPRILSLLLIVVCLLILYYTNIGSLSFSRTGQPYQRIVNSIQVFILFTVVFSYIMAGIIQVRREAEENVKRLNEELEERVLERTKALQHTLGALRQSEEQFREAFETSLLGMALVSLKGNFLRVNQAFSDMVGYPVDQFLKLNLRKITFRDDYVAESKMFKKLSANEISYYQIEKRLLQKDNLMVWVLESNSLIKTPSGEPLHIVSQIVDITERKQVEEQLRKYTETLTVLLREVNHRVKNNLFALIGILHMEEDRAVSQGKIGYTELLREVNSRIRGLATVHSMLSAGNWQPLEISELSGQIIRSVFKSLPFDREVSLKINDSNIKISSNQAHHLTLVINELATNSVKYGLGESSERMIEMKIEENDGKIHIVYRDNGPGFPDPIINDDFSNVGIGFDLIRGIVTQSLDGELKFRNEEGAVTEIFFANELS